MPGPTWSDKTRDVEEAAISALIKLNATSERKKKGNEIYEKACQIQPDFHTKVNEGNFKSYLSSLSRNSESRIVKDAGSHGYYLREAEPTDELLADEIPTLEAEDEIKKQERKENEKLIYPILSTWLQSQGYRTKDTSQMRGMGRWGNPDITGIIVDDSLGSYDIELATIEAKVTHLNYRYDFFEAVSHKRFANRVYFAFAATGNFLRENNEELRYYSELYGVGVVVIVLEDPHFKEYIEGKLNQIDTDRVDVYEIFSATFEPRLRRWQKSFLDQLGISTTQALWGWGDI
jgi:hypothetical protein